MTSFNPSYEERKAFGAGVRRGLAECENRTRADYKTAVLDVLEEILYELQHQRLGKKAKRRVRDSEEIPF